MGNIAIITARGGSKRIPRKNIRPFLGRPIVEYSIEAALQTELFDEVMVSTDDGEIAGIAQKAGAKVPFFRSERTSNDFATTADVVDEVLACYENMGETFEKACVLYPTAPFVTADAIRSAMLLLEQKRADACIPVVRFSFPPQRCVVIREERLMPRWPENMAKRSQDLEPFYHDCGQFCFLRTEALLRERNIFCQNMVPMILSDLEVQDIDNETDWELAELKYSLLKRKGIL